MYRVKQRVGKYRIEGKIGEGGFAVVYRAMDTIEGIRVALKVPHPHLVASDVLDGFREEARLAARLEHANILPLKYADYIGGHFTFVYRLGERTLEDRLRQRMSPHTALNYWEQTVSAVAYAHEHRVIHCDIKPDNLIWVVVGDREKIESRIRELEIGEIILLDTDGNEIQPTAAN